MKKLQIDIVSDIMCPWCIVGYKGLEAALGKLSSRIEASINWLPFELNPQMPIEGQDITEHLIEKYGITEQQSIQNRSMLIARGKEVDFDFNFSKSMLMINSFNLHRLLAWAKDLGKQNELQMALFSAHFTNNLALNNNDNLMSVINSVGLDITAAKEIINTNAYAEQVRSEQKHSMNRGINSVPTFIINNKYSISGGQTADAFTQVLVQIMQDE